jgi:hypothetical protein
MGGAHGTELEDGEVCAVALSTRCGRTDHGGENGYKSFTSGSLTYEDGRRIIIVGTNGSDIDNNSSNCPEQPLVVSDTVIQAFCASSFAFGTFPVLLSSESRTQQR